jgi:hypothetical protein
MAGEAERLAGLVAAGEADLAAGLPRQLVHGDFWDDNVFFRGQEPVFVADFSFMADRARIDDLALTLYYTDTELGLADAGDRIAALRPLVQAYQSGLDKPLTDAERGALPWAIARQPLWGIGGWWHSWITRTPPVPTPAPPSPPSSAPCCWPPISPAGSPRSHEPRARNPAHPKCPPIQVIEDHRALARLHIMARSGRHPVAGLHRLAETDPARAWMAGGAVLGHELAEECVRFGLEPSSGGSDDP